MRWTWFWVLVVMVWVAVAREDEATCLGHGFVKEELDCGDCERLEKVVGSGKISDQGEKTLKLCKECCTVMKEVADVIYRSADIVLDMNYLRRFPQLEAFIDEKAPGFSDVLKVKTRWGVRPQLILRDEAGKKVSTIGIENWETDHLEEFIKSKVKK